MKEILLFAGTTEGRKLSEYLAGLKVRHTICVATEYGENVLEKHPLATVHKGRMDVEEIRNLIQTGNFAAVVDATHPYAEKITCNIRAAINDGIQKMDVPYLRLKREGFFCKEDTIDLENKSAFKCGMSQNQTQITYFENKEACAQALEHTKGNILLTTGSKDLAGYCHLEQVKKRLYVRVLPGLESISLCFNQGLSGKQIIAMQGPFTVEMNEAVIRQYEIQCLVTKESGTSGGFPEKLKAAERAGIQIFVIGRPGEEEGLSFSEVCVKLEEICGKKFHPERLCGEGFQEEGSPEKISIKKPQKKSRLKIILAGIGMGHENCLTKEVLEAIDKADILLGSDRVLVHSRPGQETYPYYQAAQILPFLKKIQEDALFMEQKKVVVLFSGDTGFYSGCRSLYAALEQQIRTGELRASVCILPGISSVAYLAACIGESYQDAAVYSLHGKELHSLPYRIKHSRKTFFLTSGVQDVNRLGRCLLETGLGECEITAGFQLSYEEQKISKYTPKECCELKTKGLYTCFVKNPGAAERKLTHGLSDEAFLRGQVPMTKEEVREVSICKLRLCQNAVVYDIGSGTGSVAVEIAGLSEDIQVFAVERKKEAVSLIQKNKEKFRLENITVAETEAPEGLDSFPFATHAFIGGSGGKLRGILEALRQINPKMRVVLNAVTLETLCEIQEMLSVFEVTKEEIVQIQVGRAKKAGEYHLMRAENPVWICAFEFAG